MKTKPTDTKTDAQRLDWLGDGLNLSRIAAVKLCGTRGKIAFCTADRERSYTHADLRTAINAEMQK